MMLHVICGAGTAQHLVKIGIQGIIFDTIGKLTITVSRLTGSLVQWIEQPISNR